MVLINSWNIEQYGTSVGEDFKMKLFNIKTFYEILVH